jgi:hypothetical protein
MMTTSKEGSIIFAKEKKRGFVSNKEKEKKKNSKIRVAKENQNIIVGVFFTPIRYRVIKIICFCFKVVLQITKQIIFYPNVGSSLEVIALCPTV